VVAVADCLNNTRVVTTKAHRPFKAVLIAWLEKVAKDEGPHMQIAVEIIKKNKKMGMRDFNVRVRALAVRVHTSNGAIADEDDAGDQIDC
jgi:hypothetical protein